MLVRAVDRLLQHHLGPGVACKALALAAGVGDLVDLRTVELLLDEAMLSGVGCAGGLAGSGGVRCRVTPASSVAMASRCERANRHRPGSIVDAESST